MSAVLLCALCVAPANALEYTFSGADDYLFGRPTTKTNYHKRSLTIEKMDAGTGAPVPNTTFHVRGVNVAYENDVTTGAGGKATLGRAFRRQKSAGTLLLF